MPGPGAAGCRFRESFLQNTRCVAACPINALQFDAELKKAA